MTQAIDQDTLILNKFHQLTPEKQQQMIDFIDFLLVKAKEKQGVESDEISISALEAAGDVVGCVDWGPGDLASNKKYLEGLE